MLTKVPFKLCEEAEFISGVLFCFVLLRIILLHKFVETTLELLLGILMVSSLSNVPSATVWHGFVRVPDIQLSGHLEKDAWC